MDKISSFNQRLTILSFFSPHSSFVVTGKTADKCVSGEISRVIDCNPVEGLLVACVEIKPGVVLYEIVNLSAMRSGGGHEGFRSMSISQTLH